MSNTNGTTVMPNTNGTTVMPNSNNGIADSANAGGAAAIKPPLVEEALVVDATVPPPAGAPDAAATASQLLLMSSALSLSSASPAASVDLVETDNDAASGAVVPVPFVPPTPPIRTRHAPNGTATTADAAATSPMPPPVPSSSPNSANAHFNSDFLSCFAPLGRFWPHNLFNWSSTQKHIHSDSDTETYEIPIDSIDVQWEENFIGGGNQSSVFRGKYRGQWIALKKLNRTSEVDIKRLCSLEHGNVIKTLGICTKEHFPCIVMEYCEQGSLFEYLRLNPKISKSMFINCSTQIADGMCYLHSLKIVHRDLKSPNILIDAANTVKICDFGSLYSWDQRHASQSQHPQGMASVVMSVCGTSQWMSPEMLTNKPCNERVDVWSYGVVLWELLTGEVPYDKMPPTAVWFLVGSGNLQLHVPKTAPTSVSFLLTLCWAKNPRNRPSFKTILKDLLSNVKAELLELQEEGWGYRRAQWKRDIGDKMAKLHNTGMDFMGEQQREQELVKKRMHELRHAQEIRQMYEEKLQRVNKMHTKMCRFTELINERKRDNERCANALRERLAYDAHWHATLHEWHAELDEWHTELRHQRAVRGAGATTRGGGPAIKIRNKNNEEEELRHILLRAEAAKTAAMLTHGEAATAAAVEQQQRERQQVHHDNDGGQAVSAPPATIGRQQRRQRRPAMLRMTYYDDDDGTTVGRGRHDGDAIIVQQRVVAQPHRQAVVDQQYHQHHQRRMLTNIGTGKVSSMMTMDAQLTRGHSRMIQAPSAASASSSCSTTPPLSRHCSSADEDDAINEWHQRQRQQKPANHWQGHHHHHQAVPGPPGVEPSAAVGGGSGTASRSCDNCSNKKQQSIKKSSPPATMTAQQQQQNSPQHGQQHECQRIMCACPFSSSSVALRNSFSRHSADYCVEQTPSKPISRDDSAISSTIMMMPFSPSDRSLQNLSPSNNSGGTSSTTANAGAMPCLNCQFGIQPQQISQFFARNSVARASGLSADSGVCQEEECLESPINRNWLNAAAGNNQINNNTCCLAPNTCQCSNVGGIGTTSKSPPQPPLSKCCRGATRSNNSSGSRWSPPAAEAAAQDAQQQQQQDMKLKQHQKQHRLRRRRRLPSLHHANVHHQQCPASSNFCRHSSLRKAASATARRGGAAAGRSRLEQQQQGPLDNAMERSTTMTTTMDSASFAGGDGQLFLTTTSATCSSSSTASTTTTTNALALVTPRGDEQHQQVVDQQQPAALPQVVDLQRQQRHKLLPSAMPTLFDDNDRYLPRQQQVADYLQRHMLPPAMPALFDDCHDEFLQQQQVVDQQQQRHILPAAAMPFHDDDDHVQQRHCFWHSASTPELCEQQKRDQCCAGQQPAAAAQFGIEDPGLQLEEIIGDAQQVAQEAIGTATTTLLVESLLSSTMVSSLERSLELSLAAHSDGLSDKEATLKEVKTRLKLTHRRTSSNPTYLSRTIMLPPPAMAATDQQRLHQLAAVGIYGGGGGTDAKTVAINCAGGDGTKAPAALPAAEDESSNSSTTTTAAESDPS